jgi:hypothetical protein
VVWYPETVGDKHSLIYSNSEKDKPAEYTKYMNRTKDAELKELVDNVVTLAQQNLKPMGYEQYGQADISIFQIENYNHSTYSAQSFSVKVTLGGEELPFGSKKPEVIHQYQQDLLGLKAKLQARTTSSTSDYHQLVRGSQRNP